ncbi:hypothetical protein NQ176_g6230 [Zarea fungicola]|uniref:Uncharacterized protein n=1 Tax=Zarea fungicola TaxID=93591 RepID=A0ACC1N5D6_9HYPO|nr:hypothetical protein NQ176_g6230 [Lecanicillium fungicola]
MPSAPQTQDLSAWFTKPEQVKFAHARLPDEVPTKQIKYIVNVTDEMAAKDHLIVILVADPLERQLLVADLLHREAELMTGKRDKILIYDYAEFYAMLNHEDGWKGWFRKQVTIACHIDLHFSAAFALCMIHLMLVAKNPFGNTFLRVLTLSDSEMVEKPLWDCMVRLGMLKQNFSHVRLGLAGAQPTPGQRIDSAPWSETESFASFVSQESTRNFNCRDSTLVACSEDDCTSVNALVAGKLPFIYLEETMIPTAIKTIHSKGEAKVPTMYIMTGSSQLLVHFENVAGFFTSGRRFAGCWESGRIVDSTILQSRREMRQAVNHSRYSRRPVITIRYPADSEHPENPPRKVDNGDAWGFLAGLSLALDRSSVDFLRIAGCFMSDHAALYGVLRQLHAMDFMEPDPSRPGYPVFTFPRRRAVACVRRLLPILHFDFTAAWFLAVGLDTQGVSRAAQRAMVVIAAITTTPGSFVAIKSLCEALDEAAAEKLSGKTETLSQDLSMIFGHTLRNGKRIDLYRSHMVPVLHRVQSILNAIGDTSLLGPEPLQLTEKDCDTIQSAICLAWHPYSVAVRVDGDGGLVITDLVTKNCQSFEQSTLDPFQILLALGTPGTDDRELFVAAREVSRAADGRLCFSKSVVLPFTVIEDRQAFSDLVAFEDRGNGTGPVTTSR